jgi:hypothetical protein
LNLPVQASKRLAARLTPTDVAIGYRMIVRVANEFAGAIAEQDHVTDGLKHLKLEVVVRVDIHDLLRSVLRGEISV